MTFLITLAVIILVVYIIFKPSIDVVPLTWSTTEDYVILWYNKYTIKRFKINIQRDWITLFSIEK